MSHAKDLHPIGAAARLAGVSTQTLQYYIMIGLIDPTEVTQSGRRLFDAKAIDKVKLIKTFNASGYPLRAIRELFIEQEKSRKGVGP